MTIASFQPRMNNAFSILGLIVCVVIGVSTPSLYALGTVKNSAMQDSRASFIENGGQIIDQNGKVNRDVLFLAHEPGLNVQLRRNGFSYDTYYYDALPEGSKPRFGAGGRIEVIQRGTLHFQRIDVELVDANPAPTIQHDAGSAFVENFYTTGTPDGGVLAVHHYQTVRYRNVWPSIDLEFFVSAEGKTEYQFVVRPGGNRDKIQLRYHGAQALRVLKGRVVLQLAKGRLSERIPASYTLEDRRPFAVCYEQRDTMTIGFRLPMTSGKGLGSKTLVIDPTPSLNWGTFYGGDSTDQAFAICVDSLGNSYTVGLSSSVSRIATAGAYQTMVTGDTNSDMFIVKMSPFGIRYWGTYYGASAFDVADGVCCDGYSNIYLCGHTESNGLASPGAYQTAFAGSVLARFSTEGQRIWSTYYGYPTLNDWATGICMDQFGNVVFCGTTKGSGNLIASTGAFQTTIGSGTFSDAYVAKFSSAGNRIWGSYFGGSSNEEGLGVWSDKDGNIVMTGLTSSISSIATSTGFQQGYGGGTGTSDAFLVKCSGDGNTKLWATYYGGLGTDIGYAVLCDSARNVYLYGVTGSSGNIGTGGTQQPSMIGGLSDDFLAKFNSAGQRLWGTYVGGSQGELCMGTIAQDLYGNVIVSGSTGSSDNFSTSDAFQLYSAGPDDAFVSKYNGAGMRIWSTFYGGPSNDFPTGVAAYGTANIFVCGYTKSAHGLETPGALQPRGDSVYRDGFIARMWDCKVPTPNIQSSGNTYVCMDDFTSYFTTDTVQNSFSWSTPALGTVVSGIGTSRLMLHWTKAGKDTLFLRETNPKSGCYKDTLIAISVFERPVSNAGTNVSICRGGSVQLSGKASGGTGSYQYLWLPSDSLNATNRPDPTAHPTTTTVYTLNVSDAHGCQGLSTVKVTVYDPPKANAGTNTTICSGDKVMIGSAAAPHCSYTWSPSTNINSTTIAQPTVNPTMTTVYKVEVRNDSTHCVDSAFVVISVNSPSASFASSIHFSSLGACESSGDTTISIRNSGDDTLRIQSQSCTNSDFSVITALPIIIAPGKSANVVIRFHPSQQGSSSATLSLSALPCNTTLAIQVDGSKAQVSLQASPALVDFLTRSACAAGLQVDTVLTIVNNGTSAMQLNAPSIASPYSVLSPSFPQQLPAGDSIQIHLRFQPTSTGSYAEELRIPYTFSGCSDTLRIALNGTIVSPAITSSDSTINFGSLGDCDAARDSLLSIINGAEIEQQVVAVRSTGSAFKISSALPLVVAAHDSAHLTVHFDPTTIGVINDTLILTIQPCNRELRIAVQGTKTGQTLSVSDTVDLGSVVNCSGNIVVSSGHLHLSGSDSAFVVLRSLRLDSNFNCTLALGDSVHSTKDLQFSVSYKANAGTAAGVLRAHLILGFDPCNTQKDVVVQVMVNAMSLHADSLVDFGAAAAGDVVSKDILYVNNGSSSVTIPALPNMSLPFQATSSTPAIPCVVLPGDTLVVHATYTAPSTPGASMTTAEMQVASPCPSGWSTILQGTSSTPADSATMTIALNAIAAPQGSSVALTMRLLNAQGMELSSAPQHCTATIQYNRDVLYLNSYASQCPGDSSLCEIQVDGVRPSSGDTLALIPGIVTLGSTDFAPIVLSNVRWTDGSLRTVITKQDGSVQLTGGCDNGGVRLFIPGAVGTSLSTRPNPASDQLNIQFGLAEQSTVNLSLENFSGQNVATILSNTSKTAGLYTMQYDLSALPSGAYYLVLQTQNYSVASRVDVVK